MFSKTNSKNIEMFVKEVMEKAGIDINRVCILDNDLSRIYLAVDGNENNYNIRMWNIKEQCIEYTLFKLLEDYGEEVIKGEYFYTNI